MTKEEYKDLVKLAQDFGFIKEFRAYDDVKLYTYEAIQKEILHNADWFIRYEQERQKIIKNTNDRMLCAYKLLELKKKRGTFEYDYV